MSVKVTPLHDRVIVKPAEKAEKTAGGIIIPDTAQFGKYGGTEIELDGDKFLLLKESDIFAII